MKRNLQSRQPRHVLLSDLASLISRSRANTASLLAHLGEFDARKLYLEQGCASMFDYCVLKLHMDEDEVQEPWPGAPTDE